MPTPDGDPTSPMSPASDASHDILISFIRRSPLGYGDWARFKQLYKQTEANPAANAEVLAELIARIDSAEFGASDPGPGIQFKVGRGGSRILIYHGVAYVSVAQWNGPGVIHAYALNEADPQHPTPLGKSQFSDGFSELIPCGPYLAGVRYGYGNRNITLLDISNPASIRTRGSVALTSQGTIVGDGRALTMLEHNWRGPSRLHIVDISNPDALAKPVRLEIPEALRICAGDGLVCVGVGRASYGGAPTATKDDGLHLIDVRNPQKPRVAGFFPLPGLTALALAHQFAFVGVVGANNEKGLGVIDLRDPSRPVRGAFLNLSSPPSSIRIQGSRAFITMRSQKTAIVDLSDIHAPRLIGRSKAAWGDVSVQGSRAYATIRYRLQALDLTHIARPSVIGQSPSPDTYAYMKRRARRLLRGLAKTDPAQFALLAHKALSHITSADLNLRTHWVTLDLLYGQSDRYRQSRHGRGAYVPNQARLRLRTREERAPEAWNARPDLAADLFQNPDLPWQVHEFAWKVLRDTNTPLPRITSLLMKNMLTSPSPLLVRVAVREAAARIAEDRTIDPSAAADAYLRAGVRLRGVMQEGLAASTHSSDWRLEFARRLLAQIIAQSTNAAGARRVAGAALLLATLFADTAGQLRLLDAAEAFLAARRAPLTEMIVAAARAADASEASYWALTLTAADAAQQEAVTQALEAAIAGKSLTAIQARALVLHAHEAVRQAGWRILAASATGQSILQPIWASLLVSTGATPELRTAMSSAAALSLLERAGYHADAIAAALAERPFLVDLLTAATFARMSQTLPATVTLTLIAAASDAQWETLRLGWLRNLQEGVGVEDLWRGAENAISNAEDNRLERRLLLDADVAHTFLACDDAAFLNIREPAFGFLLERWARGHEALFPRDSALLLQAATHVLPEVRTWGLARASEIGMELPFALRLLESEVPASAAVGQAFFEAASRGDRQERNHALALCDSPKASVRTLGREFVRARRDSLPMTEILKALFEHDAADMQAFVAELLQDGGAGAPAAALFERTVLRARHRGRRAKELVKAHQNASPTVDVATLLSLARGRTARDSEWAYAELAKRVLAGETIDGFALDGPAGG